MNIINLQTYVWVASFGSFRKVAEMLHTTQPAISNRIASLESELGVRLFERGPGPAPITLTAKGAELLPFAEKILYNIRKAQVSKDPKLFKKLKNEIWNITISKRCI